MRGGNIASLREGWEHGQPVFEGVLEGVLERLHGGCGGGRVEGVADNIWHLKLRMLVYVLHVSSCLVVVTGDTCLSCLLCKFVFVKFFPY